MNRSSRSAPPSRRDEAAALRGPLASFVHAAKRLGSRLSTAVGSRAPLVGVAFGIDGFEAMRELHGAAASESVRAEIERRLRSCLHRRGRLERHGPGGFSLVMPLAAEGDARRLAESIRLAAVAAPVTARGVYHAIGMTGGVARRAPGETVGALLGRAERARAGGGRRGANRVHLATGDGGEAPTAPAGRPVGISRARRARRASC